MKYYVNEGNKIGFVFDAVSDFEAVAKGTARGFLKNWKTVNIYCQTTKETVTRDFPVMSCKRWLEVVEEVPAFLETDKPLWN